MRSLDRRWVAMGVGLALVACNQDPEQTDPRRTGGEPGEQELVETSLECPPEASAKRGITFDTLRRLSRDELDQTLRDLIGDTLYEEAAIAPRVLGLPSDQTLVPGDFSQSPPVGWAGVLDQIAQTVAGVAATDATWRGTYLHACAEIVPITDECVDDVIEDWGARVWRRPLTVDEADDYALFVDDLGGGERGLSLLVQRMLQGPSLVFHIEDGTGKPDNGRLRLTDHEVASRVSYLTTGGPPDAALYEAAANGALGTVEEVRLQVDRLLDTPASRARVGDFFRFYTHLAPGSDPSEALALHNGIDPTGVGQAMYDEAFAFFDDLVYQEGTYVDLMTSTVAHPPTANAAAVFGADAPGTVDAPEHPGLLHRPALLTSYGDRTSPIIRGAHLRKLFLCDELGLPDPEAVEIAQEELGDTSLMPNREAVDALTSGGGCVACHLLVNPVGHTFEAYDQMGVPRAEEALFDGAGEVVRSFPIDTTVNNIFVGSNPVAVADSHELVDLLSTSIQARQCLSRRLFEYYHLTAFDRDLDTCSVLDVDERAEEGTLRDAIATAIANSDIFWKEDPR